MLDEKWYEEDWKLFSNFSESFNYRLIQYEELPNFVKDLQNPVKKETFLNKRLRPNLEHINEDSDGSVGERKKKIEKKNKEK